MPTPSRIGAVQTRTVVAVALAALGIGAVTWSALSLRREPRPQRRTILRASEGGGGPGSVEADESRPGERRVEVGPGEGAPRIDPRLLEDTSGHEFARVKAAADIPPLMDQMSGALAATMEQTPDLARFGIASHDDLIAATRSAVQPALSGSEQEYAQALAALGATEAESREFAFLKGVLEWASLDLARMRVEPVDFEHQDELALGMPTGGNVNVAMRRMDDGTGEVTIATVSMPMGHAFPDVADFRTTRKRAVEIWIPFQAKGRKSDDKDGDLVLTMVWNTARSRWQPANYDLQLRNMELVQSVMNDVRKSRKSAPPG